MNIFFYQKLNSIWTSNLEKIRSEFPHVQFLTESDEPDMEEIEVVVGGKPTKEFLSAAPRLKLVIVPFAGVNHLPLEFIAERGIRVANSHGNAPDVAERTLAMILAWYGKIVEYHNDLLRGQWHGFWVGRGLDDTWKSIRGSRCAILGTGEIGIHLARLLAPLEVETIGYKRRPVSAPIPGFSRISHDLDEVIDAADTVVIALPATDATIGLFDEKRLSRMEGKLLVNVGRGSIVDEAALSHALEAGTLAGAAIDCWYSYPTDGTIGAPARLPFYKQESVLLSPHIAGFTPQALTRNIEQAFENLRRYLRDRSLLFEINPSGGY
ncbi:2-hydroxyacid dehydrogenase [Sediminispirochaeta smaragdinae]|uniref:D-isomer specific 2-hydroxyacid dehydrogenase NAD-binding protein n=1 Tax=Sediminispirochaeta smaragdinae (strain DSM 11293 / JCM 15392 / SEBR 4228) TaxID=573413 RepID=E1RAW6_SEDSS|nr:2-hydroxyacid dehydrogenase [Sediminispirochaeta smaragdinae]ADK79496.1 D-isomer specific 2-hydroxyacid dehydrogenase NAD-binding protein [Sediminispirochaeta smaragdinae DSM 11293]